MSTRTKILIALQLLLLALIILYGRSVRDSQEKVQEYLDNETYRLHQVCERCQRDCELRRNYDETNHDITWKWWVECPHHAAHRGGVQGLRVLEEGRSMTDKIKPKMVDGEAMCGQIKCPSWLNHNPAGLRIRCEFGFPTGVNVPCWPYYRAALSAAEGLMNHDLRGQYEEELERLGLLPETEEANDG
jgi:hypothetical protein